MRRFGEFFRGERDVFYDADEEGTSIEMQSPDNEELKTFKRMRRAGGLEQSDDVSSIASSDDSSPTPEQLGKRVKACLRFMLPVLTGSVALFILVMILLRSGSSGSEGSPRAAVFIFEGLKGTEFDMMVNDGHRAPNIKELIKNGGIYAPCLSVSDSRCARVQSGASLGGGFSWTSAPGIASILTGVNSNKHLVSNNSFDAMSKFSQTSAKFPTFIKTVRESGARVAVIGSSHLITSVGTKTGKCTAFGVLDFECGADAFQRCLRSSSCNADSKFVVDSNGEDGAAEELISDDLLDMFEDGPGADLLVILLPRPAIVAEDPSMADASYKASSLPYAAALYYADAIVGQVMAITRSRSFHYKENWLLIGTGDHGGLDKSSGFNSGGDDAVVPFFMTTQTTFGHALLSKLTVPTTQFDVAPTVLRWFGLDGSDDEDEKSKGDDFAPPAKKDGDAPAQKSPAILLPTSFDGVVQGICSNGKNPRNCSAADV